MANNTISFGIQTKQRGRVGASQPVFPMTVRQVYDFLKTKRELNIDTLKSTITVNQDYSDYVESLADDLGINENDCLEIMQELEALEYIFCMPQADSWIDYIEIDG